MWKRKLTQASSIGVGLEWGGTAEERELVTRIIACEGNAIAQLVDRYHESMASVTSSILGDADLVPDVLQESWIRILNSIGSFEFRSTLKTWILRITANVAKTMASRSNRNAQTAGIDVELTDHESAVDPRRFHALGGWRDPPQPWHPNEPEAALLQKEECSLIWRELRALPPKQRAVVVLHDVEELGPQEICEMLEISEANQRILLHRARARLRSMLEKERRRP